MVDINNKSRLALIGEFIKQKREAIGLSQRALGLLFNPPVTTQFISNIERGVTPLPPIHVPILAKALSTTEGEIMALLEKEYAMKLNGRLGKMDKEQHNGEAHIQPLLAIASSDYDFMKGLYEAYRIADPKTKESFTALCQNILKLSQN